MKRIVLFIILVLGVPLTFWVGAATARGNAGARPATPPSLFGGPLESEVLAMPAPDFRRELSRLLRLPPPVRAGAPLEADALTSAPLLLDLDVSELSAALKAAVTSATQARELAAGYRALHQALRQAAPGKHFSAVPYQRLMTALPWEFVLYTQGAVAWQNGNTTQAVEAWRTLLTLPAKERHYRSTWAAGMIGRTLAGREPQQAVAAFEECRRLAGAGFADSLGLAARSLGWQAHVELNAGQFREAIDHYVEAGRARPGALDGPALKAACAAILKPGAGIPATVVQDPVCRAALSAYFLAGEGEAARAGAWLQILGSAAIGVLTPEEAESLAWLAYRRGDLALARRWLGRTAAEPGAVGRWLRAKLWLRDGQLEQAVAELEALRILFAREDAAGESDADHVDVTAPANTPGRAVCSELAALYTGQGRFVQAFDASLGGGRWPDIAYLAERVLTSAELADTLDAHQGSPDLNQPLRLPQAKGPLGKRLDWLLARRLLREGQYARAHRYFERGAPELLGCQRLGARQQLRHRTVGQACFELGQRVDMSQGGVTGRQRGRRAGQ
jgi:tetratricopeptide (TPR) repeat protein